MRKHQNCLSVCLKCSFNVDNFVIRYIATILIYYYYYYKYIYNVQITNARGGI